MNLHFSHLKVVLLCIGGAVAYGIIHDQITARLCIEYFTVAHPPLVHTTSPTLIALAWGVAATFWVGLVLGLPLALASQSPSDQPPVPLARIGKDIAALLAVMAVAAFFAGVIGFELSRGGSLSMPDCWADDIPVTQHHRFMAAWFAHGASYLFGLLGGIFLIFATWNRRGRPAVLHILPQSGSAALRAILLIT